MQIHHNCGRTLIPTPKEYWNLILLTSYELHFYFTNPEMSIYQCIFYDRMPILREQKFRNRFLFKPRLVQVEKKIKINASKTLLSIRRLFFAWKNGFTPKVLFKCAINGSCVNPCHQHIKKRIFRRLR